MFSFLFKKSIYDGWDHILGLFLANIGYLFILAVEALLWYLNAKGIMPFSLSAILIALFVPFISAYSLCVCCYTAGITEDSRKTADFGKMKELLVKHIPHTLCNAFIVIVVGINFLFATPFYFRMGGFFGPLMSFVSVFLSLFIIFCFKYYLPLTVLRPEASVMECIKYSFAYSLDNKGVTLLLLLRSILDIFISVPLMGLVPGFCGIFLSDNCAAKMLNTRYLLAEEKNSTKNSILWSDVTEKMDSKRYSTRSFKSFLFPRR